LARKEKKMKRKGEHGRRKGTDMEGVYQAIGELLAKPP